MKEKGRKLKAVTFTMALVLPGWMDVLLLLRKALLLAMQKERAIQSTVEDSRRNGLEQFGRKKLICHEETITEEGKRKKKRENPIFSQGKQYRRLFSPRHKLLAYSSCATTSLMLRYSIPEKQAFLLSLKVSVGTRKSG